MRSASPPANARKLTARIMRTLHPVVISLAVMAVENIEVSPAIHPVKRSLPVPVHHLVVHTVRTVWTWVEDFSTNPYVPLYGDILFKIASSVDCASKFPPA